MINHYDAQTQKRASSECGFSKRITPKGVRNFTLKALANLNAEGVR